MTLTIDDILVSGCMTEEHNKNLEEVFRRLNHHGIHLKKDNASFFNLLLSIWVIVLMLKERAHLRKKINNKPYRTTFLLGHVQLIPI